MNRQTRSFQESKSDERNESGTNIYSSFSQFISDRKNVWKNSDPLRKLKSGGYMRINGLLTHLMQIYRGVYLNGKLSSLRKG